MRGDDVRLAAFECTRDTQQTDDIRVVGVEELSTSISWPYL
jgi:hypothetical protein